MIGYLDTSALVPLLVTEPSSAACARFWDDADALVTCRLTYVEAAAALAQARRLGRLDAATHTEGRDRLDELWEQLDVVDIDGALILAAADLADRLGLRGYDAVHCASAAQLADPALVAAAGDHDLLDGWHRLGIATFDPNLAGR